MSTGYLHPDYAASLAEFGTPWELPHCQGWILERQIPGFPDRDAMGCYPLFACEDWSQLHRDLDELGGRLVSLSLVADPFGEYDEAYLHRCFDLVIPFKEHFIVDLNHPINDIVSRDARACAERAKRKGVHVEVCEDPTQFIETWMALHSVLAKRHNIKGIKAFSRTAFVKQFKVPGLMMLRVVHQDATVAIGTLAVHERRAYTHVAAYSENAHNLNASCALYWSTIEHLSHKVHWIDWGGGAGIKDVGTDGLSQFKRRWSTHTRTVYFCGRIFDHDRYSEIAKAKGVSAAAYFPAYREGEFG